MNSNFDEEIKQQLDGRKFTPSANAWSAMQALIEKEEQKKKKRRFIFFWIVPGFSLLIFSFLFFDFFSDAENSKKSTLAISEKKEGPVEFSYSTNVSANKNPGTIPAVHSPDGKSSSSSGDGLIKKQKEKRGPEEKKSAYKKREQKTLQKKNTLANVKGKNTSEINKTKGKNTLKNKIDNSTYIANMQVLYVLPPASNSLAGNFPKMQIIDNSAIADSIFKSKNGDEVTEQFYVLVNAGPSLNAALELSGGQTPAINPHIEFAAGKRFGKSFFAEAGLFYTSLGKISQAPSIFTSNSYSLGYMANTTEIDIRNLHYAGLRLGVLFNRNKFSFSAGTRFSYLVSTSCKQKTYTESYGIRNNVSELKAYGYAGGIFNYDLQADVGFSYGFSKRFSAGCFMNFGFIDLKNNSYFSNPAFERSKSLRLIFSYKFLSVRK
ncbi:MAG: hypothetical protein IAF38_05610 [Bacteroidia bacterium]|nr:hypothetical protein [Bacteroidia bacterium]